MAQKQSKMQQEGSDQESATPGEILVKAREAAAISRARVAAELGLTENAVRDLEANQFEKFAAGIYVRGYLRNYCKLLSMDEKQLLDDYDQYCSANGLADSPKPGSGRVMTADHRRPLLIGIVIGLVALSGIFLLIWLANL